MDRTAERLRKPWEPRATSLELFFDLAFVFALTQVSRVLIHDLTWRGAFHALLLFLAVWRVWFSTAALTDRFNPHLPVVQVLVLATMVGSLVLGAAMPAAFGDKGLTFAGVYVAIQVGRNFILLVALRGDEYRSTAGRLLFWFSVSAVPWISGGLAQGAARGVLWTLALAVEFAAFALDFPTPVLGRAPSSHLPSVAKHLAERYQEFFTIALGELTLISGMALSGTGIAEYRIAAFGVSMATTVLLWRNYIYRAEESLSAAIASAREPGRRARWASFSQLVMVAGAVVTAVGAEHLIDHPFGPARPAWIAVVLGGPALFLAGRILIEYEVFGRVARELPIGLLVLAALAPAMVLLQPLVIALVPAGVLAGIAISDTARARGRRPEPPKRARASVRRRTAARVLSRISSSGPVRCARV